MKERKFGREKTLKLTGRERERVSVRERGEI
jgi:hypothetical protein